MTTTMTTIKKTKTGKIHLSESENAAICCKMKMNFTETVSFEDGLKEPKSSFCKSCFTIDPYEQINLLKDSDSVIELIFPPAVSDQKPAKKSKTDIGRILKNELDKALKNDAIEPEKEIAIKSPLEEKSVIMETIDRLRDEKKSSKNAHAHFKIGSYIKALDAVLKMLETGDPEQLEDLRS